jgi:hypothetical protein
MLSFAFCSLLSDDDDPKRDAAASPLLDTLIITKASSQKEAVVVKSLELSPKKSTPVRASKRLKKVVAASTSLEIPRPAASSENMSKCFLYSKVFCCLNFPDILLFCKL